MSGPRREHILVLGDLCWDLTVDDVEPAVLRAEVLESHEASLTCTSRLEVGGSAWLFAREVADAGQDNPIVIASVGSDHWGSQLVRCLEEAGLGTDLVQRGPAAHTDVLCVVRYSVPGRLMLLPERPANDTLAPAHLSPRLGSIDPRTVRWGWISGYALAGRSTPRHVSARMLADWCHAHDVPIALDLVPHDFRSRVGTLDEVVAGLGGVDLIVGAVSTLNELGYGMADTGQEMPARMRATAEAAACEWGHVLVQARTSEQEFGQVLYGSDGHLVLEERLPTTGGLRGVGDRLAVRALAALRG